MGRLRRPTNGSLKIDGGRWDALPWRRLGQDELGSFDDSVLLSIEEVDGEALSSETAGPEVEEELPTPGSRRKRGRVEDESVDRPPDRAEPPSTVTAKLADESFSEWSGIRLRSVLVASLESLGFSSPTPVQARAVPLIARGRADVVCAAETGSGKTLAFVLPVLDRLLADWRQVSEESCPFALVLSPTRELALQSAAVFRQLSAGLPGTGVRVATVVGGMSVHKQRRLLGTRGACAHVIVATPGRLAELCGEEDVPGLADLSRIRFLVVDEADRMVEEGHFPELHRVFSIVRDHEQIAASGRDPVEVTRERKAGVDEPELNEVDDSAPRSNEASSYAEPVAGRVSRRQTLLFSATLRCDLSGSGQPAKRVKGVGGVARTLPLTIQQLLGAVACRGHIEVVDVLSGDADNGSQPMRLPASLTQREVRVPAEDKDSALYYFLNHSSGRTLLFVNAIKSARRVDGLLRALNVNSRVIHAQMQQRQRLKAIDAFKAAPIGAVFP